TIDPDRLVGPVLTREAIFDFAAETVRQYETFFAVYLQDPGPLTTEGWTSVERAMIDDLRWWDLAELRGLTEQVYPEGLAEIATRLSRGWDGTITHMGEVHDPK